MLDVEQQRGRIIGMLEDIKKYDRIMCKKGTEIRNKEHKGRDYNTVTFAAPIEINGKRGNMAAVVMRIKDDKYKTHRILMPDGSEYVFEYEKTEATTSGVTEGKANGEGPDITSVDNRISQSRNDVNKFSLPETDSDIRFSMKGLVEESQTLIYNNVR